jgi:hypothetical protein
MVHYFSQITEPTVQLAFQSQSDGNAGKRLHQKTSKDESYQPVSLPSISKVAYSFLTSNDLNHCS